MGTDNCMVMARGKGSGREERLKVRINADVRRLGLGW